MNKCIFENLIPLLHEELEEVKNDNSLAKKYVPWFKNPQLKEYKPVSIGSKKYLCYFIDENNFSNE